MRSQVQLMRTKIKSPFSNSKKHSLLESSSFEFKENTLKSPESMSKPKLKRKNKNKLTLNNFF